MRLFDRLEQFVCGLKGHTTLKAFEPHRVRLRCQDCGWSSPGWTVGPEPRTNVHYLNLLHVRDARRKVA